MHNDSTLWQCLNNEFCSFKVKWKTPPQTFCKNEYNVTGLCNRVSCPLANSQYATVLEEEGSVYLYSKTVERAHSPKYMWEKVKLSNNYLQALEQVSKELEYWPEHHINRCKQRLTKIRQMLIRMRKFALKGSGMRLVPVKKKTDKREMQRELKAEAAAKVDLAIEKELLERLKQGTYGDIYNFSKKHFDSVMEQEGEMEVEDDEDSISDEEFVADMEDSENEREIVTEDGEVQRLDKIEQQDGRDMEDFAGGKSSRPSALRPKKKRRGAGGAGVEIEYEQEMEGGR